MNETIKDSPTRENLQLLLDRLRFLTTKTSIMLQPFQDSLNRGRLIDLAILGEITKNIQHYTQIQSAFQERLKSVSPKCKEEDFDAIERYLAEENKRAEALASMVQTLEKFCHVHIDDPQVMVSLEPHRAKVQKFLHSGGHDSIVSEAEPYLIFLNCLKDARYLRTLPDEKVTLLTKEFGSPIFRSLCLNEFYLGDKIVSNTRQGPAPVTPKPKLTAPAEPPKDRYLFHTLKEKTPFNGSRFLNGMREKTKQGVVFALPDSKLQIKFLVDLLLFSVLTEEQIKRYILNCEEVKYIIDFALREGYVTEITDTENQTTSYCFSPKGLQIFNTPSCKEFIIRQKFKIPENTVTSSILMNHQEFIFPTICVNNIVFALRVLMQKWRDSFFIKRISFSANFDGGKNEYSAVMSWEGPLPIDYQYVVSYKGAGFSYGQSDMEDLATTHRTQPAPLQKFIFVYDKIPIARMRSKNLEEQHYCAASHKETGKARFFFRGAEIDEEEISLNSLRKNTNERQKSTRTPVKTKIETDRKIPPKPKLAATPAVATAVGEREEVSALTDGSANLTPQLSAVPKTQADTPPAEEQAAGVQPAILKGSPRQIASDILKHERTPADFVAFMDLIFELLTEVTNTPKGDVVGNSMAQALLLLKTLSCQSENRSRYESYYQSLVFAVDSPIEKHEYRSDTLFTVFADENRNTLFHLAAVLRALFAPAIAYDYPLIHHAKNLFSRYETSFSEYTELKPLYNLFLQIQDFSPEGFSDSLLQQFSDQNEQDLFLKQIQNEALSLYEVPVIRTMVQGLPQMLNYCFGKDSGFQRCLEIILQNNRQEVGWVQDVYESFCTETESGQWRIADDKMEEWFEANWKKSREDKKMVLSYVPKEIILEGFRKRLALMKKWLDFSRPENTQVVNVEDFNVLKDKILSEIKAVSSVIEKNYGSVDQTILTTLFKVFTRRLRGQISPRGWPFADFLRTGFFALDEEGLPDIIGKNAPVRYYEPWHLALKHIAAPVISLKEVLIRITDNRFPDFFDNIGLAVKICEYLEALSGKEHESAQYLNDVPQARKTSDQRTEEFKSELEIAFAYGRVGGNDRELLSSQIEQYRDTFYTRNNFGMWQGFLQALRCNIEEISKKRFQELKQDIEKRRNNDPAPALVEILDKAWGKLQPPENNFVVAEEYINNFDSHNPDNPLEFENYEISEPDYFLKFLSAEVFDELYALCRKNQDLSFRRFGTSYVEDYLKKHKNSSQYQDSAKNLIKNLPGRPMDVTAALTRDLLQGLGFDVEDAVQVEETAGPYSHWKVNVKPDQKDEAEYAHPVDIMGTQLSSPLDVIFLFEQKQPNEIVDNICGLELKHTSIVFLNGALGLPARRQISERFHQEKRGENPFLLIDWVLLLHLATKPIAERLPVLLNCTLPYTSSFQPFVNSGAVSDEMFIGRKEELSRILDFNGPVIVYGGRQLGKTALLERASSRAHHPEKKEYSVLIAASDCKSEDELMKVLNDALIRAKLLTRPSDSLHECALALQRLYNDQKWSRLLLMIDEADKLLENFKKSSPAYSNLTPMTNLRRATSNNFKFVLAGLHNVCRAAAESHTILDQLGEPLCIKPLSAPDAWRLLTRPLSYLGFKFDSAHLEHILVNTIFHPGIIHHVGYQLVENLSVKYADYYSAAKENPPYELTDKQLGSIMSSASLNNSIDDRIKWMLEVDQRYFMLARSVAFLNYTKPEENNQGYTVADILEYAELLEISCLKNIDVTSSKNLLLEMVEMGILVQPSPDAFRLRQRRFLEVIGKNPGEIEQAIDVFEGRAKS